MIIGQARTGKTSLKRSLKGELFNPDEESTEGIETDPSYFKVTTDVWRTGQKSEDTESEPTFLLDHQVAQKIVESLRKGDRSGDPSTSGVEPSLQDSKVVEKAKPYSLRTDLRSSGTEFNSYRVVLVHQHGRRFIVLEQQYGRLHVSVKTLHTVLYRSTLYTVDSLLSVA